MQRSGINVRGIDFFSVSIIFRPDIRTVPTGGYFFSFILLPHNRIRIVVSLIGCYLTSSELYFSCNHYNTTLQTLNQSDVALGQITSFLILDFIGCPSVSIRALFKNSIESLWKQYSNSVPITTNVVSSNPAQARCTRYSIMW